LQLVRGDRLVIWGGVDTLHDWEVLQALEKEDRLLTAENVDGVRPGEAAAFVVLGPPHAEGDVAVLGVGLGREPCPVGSQQPCMSDGLSHALEAAVEPLRGAQARSNCWLLDTTHEAYGTHEVQNIIARFGDVMGQDTDLQMPFKELGDVGAASMPLLAVLGAQAWRFGHARDDTAVITASSEHGARGAMLLSTQACARSARGAA
jgi:3-oxoacyl-[acyl-carrier-protein] synthase I